jgi:hypothetical protein
MKKLNPSELAKAQAAMPTAQQNGHKPPTPAPDAAKIAEAVNAAAKAQTPDENPFPLDAFPQKIRDAVTHWHSVYRRSVDFYSSILAVASGAIGNAYHVQHTPGSVQPLALWLVIVGPPSSAKSKIMQFCLKPVFDREEQFRAEFDEIHKAWEEEKAEAERAKAKILPREPEQEQRLTSDATIESLIKLLMQSNCWKGLMVYRDEFVALLKGMGQYKAGGGGDMEHYLSLWSGMPVILNRSGLGRPGFVRNPFLAMLGSIQPKVLSGLTDNGKIDNGFLYRLLFAFPENVKIPVSSGKVLEPRSYQDYNRIISRLYDLPANDDRTPIILKMNPEAQKIYDTEKDKIEQTVMNETDDENIQSLEGKLLDYTLRIAAVLQLLEFCSGDEDDFYKNLTPGDATKILITAPIMRRAMKLTKYFRHNSEKILARAEDPTAKLSNLQRLLYEKLPNPCSYGLATDVAAKTKIAGKPISDKTAQRLLRDRTVFVKNIKDGLYYKVVQ